MKNEIGAMGWQGALQFPKGIISIAILALCLLYISGQKKIQSHIITGPYRTNFNYISFWNDDTLCFLFLAF